MFKQQKLKEAALLLESLHETRWAQRQTAQGHVLPMLDIDVGAVHTRAQLAGRASLDATTQAMPTSCVCETLLR
jgi:hypothetical protein